jgi:hypothetical protein
LECGLDLDFLPSVFSIRVKQNFLRGCYPDFLTKKAKFS